MNFEKLTRIHLESARVLLSDPSAEPEKAADAGIQAALNGRIDVFEPARLSKAFERAHRCPAAFREASHLADWIKPNVDGEDRVRLEITRNASGPNGRLWAAHRVREGIPILLLAPDLLQVRLRLSLSALRDLQKCQRAAKSPGADAQTIEALVYETGVHWERIFRELDLNAMKPVLDQFLKADIAAGELIEAIIAGNTTRAQEKVTALFDPNLRHRLTTANLGAALDLLVQAGNQAEKVLGELTFRQRKAVAAGYIYDGVANSPTPDAAQRPRKKLPPPPARNLGTVD